MSTRRRGSLLVASLAGLWLCLAGAGCSLHIGFGEQSTKPPPTSQTSAKPNNNPEPPPQPTLPTAGGTQALSSNTGSLPPPQPVLPANYPVAPPVLGPANAPPLPHGGVIHNGGVVHNGGVMNAPVVQGGPPLVGPGPAPGAPDGPALAPAKGGVPVETRMRSHPPYVVEPPDILLIDTLRMIPKPPYVISPLDILLIRLAEPLPNEPIDGNYTIGPDGTVNLGYSYGVVRLGGLTLPEAERVIRQQARSAGLRDPKVVVGLAQYRGVQQARGEHLVRQDGTISLGSYGCVYVAGLTLAQVKVAVERHLSQYVCDPEITVDVAAYNSKYYYVITDGAGYGQSLFRFPITGKETVLDAINNIGGIPAINSTRRVWVARPAPPEVGCTQILPVDWLAITQGGATGTNYQIFPGDRVFVNADAFVKADNVIGKVFAPIERILGVALLGQTLFGGGNQGGGGGGGIGIVTALP